MCSRVLCLEHPDIRTLNYSPGPLDTEMMQTIQNTRVRGKYARKWNLLQPSETVNVLRGILKENNFEDGTKIDVFDVTEEPRK